jgi:N-acetylmuramoyl-L-alanine amidase
VVDRSGGIWQCVPFTRIAYHAGHGDWEGYHNTMNQHSIGIELSNLGPMWLTEANQYVDSYGKNRTDRIAIPLPHRNAGILDLKKLFGEAAYKRIVDAGVKDPDLHNCWWEVFPDEQKRALQRLCSLLVTRYPSIRAIIGHDDYAVQRKIDPGPALELQKLLGWMPQGRTILYLDDFQRTGYAFSRTGDDFMRNLTISRTFGAGVTGRDIG